MDNPLNEEFSIYIPLNIFDDAPPLRDFHWMIDRCCAMRTSIRWTNLASENRGIRFWGQLPQEVVDMLCAIRIGDYELIESLKAMDYTERDEQAWASSRLKAIVNES